MSTARIDPRALAAQRRGRIHTLRRHVAAGAVTVLLALWGVLFVQLATGHDPGLSDAATTAVVQSADPEATDSGDGSSDASGSDDASGWWDSSSDSSDSGSDSGSSVDPGAVATRQS